MDKIASSHEVLVKTLVLVSPEGEVSTAIPRVSAPCDLCKLHFIRWSDFYTHCDINVTNLRFTNVTSMRTTVCGFSILYRDHASERLLGEVKPHM